MSGQYIDMFDDQPPPNSQVSRNPNATELSRSKPDSQNPPAALGRPYIGIYFECCGVYARVYRAPDEAEYRGTCPKCLAVVRATVGPGGVSQRIFRAK